MPLAFAVRSWLSSDPRSTCSILASYGVLSPMPLALDLGYKECWFNLSPFLLSNNLFLLVIWRERKKRLHLALWRNFGLDKAQILKFGFDKAQNLKFELDKAQYLSERLDRAHYDGRPAQFLYKSRLSPRDRLGLFFPLRTKYIRQLCRESKNLMTRVVDEFLEVQSMMFDGLFSFSTHYYESHIQSKVRRCLWQISFLRFPRDELGREIFSNCCLCVVQGPGFGGRALFVHGLLTKTDTMSCMWLTRNHMVLNSKCSECCQLQ